MKLLMRSSVRAGLIAVAALQGAALALVTPDAHATWYCDVVDGAGNDNPGEQAGTTLGCAGAVPFEGQATPVYAMFNTSYTQSVIKSGQDGMWYGVQCNGNYDPYELSVVDPTPNLNPPGAALSSGDMVGLAYTDFESNLYASYAFGPAAGTQIYNVAANGGSPQILNTPSVAFLGSTDLPYVFFTAFYPSGNYSEVMYRYYNGSTGGWSGGDPGTRLDGSSSSSTGLPAAVQWNGALWVFYWNSSLGCLMGQSSSNGSTWTRQSVANNCIDGWGQGSGSGGQTWDDVGDYPSAYVDPTDNRLYVFYWDYSADTLRFSYLANGSSTWYSGVVQTGITMAAPAAAITSNVLQVFYINQENDTLMGATRYGNTFAYQATMDGGSSNLCGSHGGTSHPLYGPISAISPGGVCRSGYGPGGSIGPHIYYGDGTTGALRELFEY